MSQTFDSFRAFYPYYLGEHRNRVCRRLHFVGTSLVIGLMLATALGTLAPLWLLALPVAGYGFAWIGHFFFEHNKPATFQYPFLSFRGDWKMWWQTLTGKIAF